MAGNDLEFIKPQNLGPLLMKSSQSNFNLRSPDSYSARSYLIATVSGTFFCLCLLHVFLPAVSKNWLDHT